MNRKEFGNILQRYLSGEATQTERELIEQWYALLDEDAQTNLSAQEPNGLETRLWSQIQKQTGLGYERPLWWQQPIIRWSAAAVALLVAGFLWTNNTIQPVSTERGALRVARADAEQIVQNTSTHAMTLTLPDSSTVVLQPRAKLTYARQFSASVRQVSLSGNAFFSVRKNPKKPFLVYTGDVVTRVLGTSFWVRTTADRRVDVDVRTGRVAVSLRKPDKTDNPANGVILTPNHRVTFFAVNRQFVTGLVAEPIIQEVTTEAAQPMPLRFKDTPFSEVLHRLEKAYGVAIEVEQERINNCPITADLTGQSLTTQLDVVCAALRATHEIRGTTIFISGQGCD